MSSIGRLVVAPFDGLRQIAFRENRTGTVHRIGTVALDLIVREAWNSDKTVMALQIGMWVYVFEVTSGLQLYDSKEFALEAPFDVLFDRHKGHFGVYVGDNEKDYIGCPETPTGFEDDDVEDDAFQRDCDDATFCVFGGM